MSDVMYRQWVLLRAIPRYPRKIDTAGVQRVFGEQGIEIHRRTIQRDLVSLSKVFPIACDDEHKPYGWYWIEDADVFDLPNMDPHTALSFALVREFLSPLMPRSTFRALEPHFRRAEEVLSVLPERGSGLREWPEKVRVLPPGQQLMPAEIKPEVLEVVYEALFQRRRFWVEYRRRGERRSKCYEVNPLGMVFRRGVLYLVCTASDYEETVQLVLHRMVGAKLLESGCRVPEGFDLDEYINAGEFAFLLGERPVRLRALFRREAAVQLMETPLSGDQRVVEVGEESGRGGGRDVDEESGRGDVGEEAGDGDVGEGSGRGEEWVMVSATVKNSMALRTWLRGYGASVVVVEPEWLREELQEEAEEMVENYSVDR